MRSALLTMALFMTMLAAPSARADALASEKPALPRPAEDFGRWSFGAGVGLTVYQSDYGLGRLSGAGAAAGLAGLGGSSGSGPFGVGLIERSLSPALRLGASVVGGYSEDEHKGNDRDPNLGPPTRTTSASAGGGVSLRWVLNPGDLVEISPFVALGAHWAMREGDVTSWTYDSEGQIVSRNDRDADGYGFNARLGLVVEYRLLTRLYLRLENFLLRLDRTHATETTRFERVDAATEVGRQNVTTTSASFAFQPMLQLRILL